MATTKIWKFKSRLNRLIDYTMNGEKTKNKLFVSGINCMPDTAFLEMINVKKQFFKTGGIECFHGYQSFVEGEVTPEQAHEIGVKLAEELWGDKFQVIVSTHINTDNIHNHFVLNSVSFLDGKRFCNTKKDYALMRKTSDKLCNEYGLSILKQEEKYDKYATSSLYKELMKDSIDYAIATSKNYNEFIKILEDLDYIVTNKNNTLTIRREPYKRNTRIERQFGKHYLKENIYKRILETQTRFSYSPEPYLLINRTRENYEKLNPEKGSLAWLFLHYMKLLHPSTENALKSNSTRMTPALLHAIKEMNEFSERVRFLCKYDLESDVDVMEFKKLTYQKLAPLKSERENLWRKHKRAKTENEKKVIEEKIIDLSKQISPVDEEMGICNNILKRVEKIKKFEIHQKLEQEKQNWKNTQKEMRNTVR